jgi:hypothetical protein
VHKSSKNWLDCVRATFYSDRNFGKLLATLANPVATPQTMVSAALRMFFQPKPKETYRFIPMLHPTPACPDGGQKTA